MTETKNLETQIENLEPIIEFPERADYVDLGIDVKRLALPGERLYAFSKKGEVVILQNSNISSRLTLKVEDLENILCFTADSDGFMYVGSQQASYDKGEIVIFDAKGKEVDRIRLKYIPFALARDEIGLHVGLYGFIITLQNKKEISRVKIGRQVRYIATDQDNAYTVSESTDLKTSELKIIRKGRRKPGLVQKGIQTYQFKRNGGAKGVATDGEGIVYIGQLYKDIAAISRGREIERKNLSGIGGVMIDIATDGKKIYTTADRGINIIPINKFYKVPDGLVKQLLVKS